MTDTISPCLSGIADLLDAEGRTAAAETANCLRAACGANPQRRPKGLEKTDAAALRALLMSSPLALASAVAAAEDDLGWGRNPVSSQVAEAVSDVPFVVANLLGPDGVIHSDTLRAGLYFQRPGTRYGLHSHAAIETYVIIAGRANWTAGEARRWLGPGEFVHHTSYLPHACETGELGVVALWRWSGDIGTDSYRVHDGHDAFAT